MSTPLTAQQLLDQEFLTIRAKLLEVAASLDRITRADGSVETAPRYLQLKQGIAVLAESEADRATQFQMTFSDPYDPNWQVEYGIADSA